MSDSDILKRLQEEWREEIAGKGGRCKMLTLGNECECHLCMISRIADSLEAKDNEIFNWRNSVASFEYENEQLKKRIEELAQEVGRLNAELMDDDSFHSMTTQRSAEDWKRMHNRVYAQLQHLEGDVERWKGISDGKQLVINRLEKEIAELNRILNDNDEPRLPHPHNHQKQSHEI